MAKNVRIVVIGSVEPGLTRATDGRISLSLCTVFICVCIHIYICIYSVLYYIYSHAHTYCVCVCEYVYIYIYVDVYMWMFSLIECSFVIPAMVLGFCLRLSSLIPMWVIRPISGNWEQIVQDRPVSSAGNIKCYQLSPQPYQQDNSCNNPPPPPHHTHTQSISWSVSGRRMHSGWCQQCGCN